MLTINDVTSLSSRLACIVGLLVFSIAGCSDIGIDGGGGAGGTGATGGTGGTGGSGDLCEGVNCDDGNECTVGTCAEGTCDSTPVADDTACGDGAGTCQEGSCSGTFACTEQGIRDAIAVGGGPHTFDCDGSMPVVTEAEIVIDNDVILDGEGNLIVDGNDDHRVFHVVEGVTAELRGLTATRGSSGTGDILNSGTMTITNSTASSIINVGNLTLTNSTVSGNAIGILQDGGTLSLTNSTVSGSPDSGAITICDTGTVTIANSTVSGSIVTVGGKGCDFPENDITITNSVVDKCEGVAPVSNGYNIESPGDTCGFDQEGDQVDVTEGELNLGPLQDNGGPTETHALLLGSVAIDAIPADMCEVTEDQRGVTRPQGTMCDVGAFELEEGSL